MQAKIIAPSVSAHTGTKLVTYELEYPRFIHAELMTHRLFSRNAASSRAIPIEKMIAQVENNTAMPYVWGLNKAGMQSEGVHPSTPTCVWAWKKGAQRAVQTAWELKNLGLHKQIVNRVLEPFQYMKTVVTATEYDNFFYLRCHKDAQPEIKILADMMHEQYRKANFVELSEGQWHTPYYKDGYWTEEDKDFTLEQALKISSSCAAQTSYRKTDDTLEKAEMVYNRLVESKPLHASPFEHQATPWDNYMGMIFTVEGVTHTDVDGADWSGNFRNWIQYRHLLEDNTCWNYEEESA